MENKYALKDLAEFTEYPQGTREGMLIRCPNCKVWGGVHFKDSEYAKKYPSPVWTATGDTLETISLTPSVRMIGHFHSWVKDGFLVVDSEFECTASDTAPDQLVRGEGNAD